MTALNRKQYIQENIATDSLKTVGKGIHDFMKDDESIIDTIQNYGDIAGMIPVVGNIVDLASAGVDVLQGQFGDAGMRTIQAVPGFGQAALGTKLGAKGLSKLGVLQRPTRALATVSKSKPAAAASVVAPFASGAVQGVKDATGTGTETETEKSAESETAMATADNQQAIARDMGLAQAVAAFQMAARQGPRVIKHGTLQRFESVSVDITRCLLENAKTRAAREAARRVLRGEDDKKQGLVSRTLVPGLGVGTAIAAAIGLPLAVGKLYGRDTSEPSGQGPGSKDASDGGVGQGTAGVLDRLSALYGFIPGFNPAGAALGALGRRVGA
tara:strand:- start:1362 stop:2345 length:984 start_codon:yes stop_codon:yes gene_type:complete